MLKAGLGGACVFARPGDRRLWVLDADTVILWDLRAKGVDPALIARQLALRFGLDVEAARLYLAQLYDGWRASGLLEQDSVGTSSESAFGALPTFSPPGIVLTPPDAWRVTIAGRLVAAQIDDMDLRAILEPLLKPLSAPSSAPLPEAIPDLLVLSGDEADWTVTINGLETDAGKGLDAAVVSTLTALTELGCRAHERLLVVHGAGLVSPDDRGLLLVAPGGFGKTTLTMALEAEGFRLLSDDLTPIRRDGAALGLGLPACIKSGGWDVLARWRPDLEGAREVLRYGQAVRFLPPRGRPMNGAITPAFLLFPHYRPAAAPRRLALPPEKALQGLVEAEAVIRIPTQETLEALCGWVGAIPAYALHYPDLATGVSLVRDLLESAPAESP